MFWISVAFVLGVALVARLVTAGILFSFFVASVLGSALMVRLVISGILPSGFVTFHWRADSVVR